jgi:integral membrane protein
MTPKKLFNFFATAEALTWTALIIAIILRATEVVQPIVSTVVGGLHGAVFLGYGVIAALVGVNQRWSAGLVIGGIALAIIPFATIPFERARNRKNQLDGPWRTSTTDHPSDQGWLDRLFRWFIARPALLIIVMVSAVSAIFALLLFVGPPTEWAK